ADLKISQSHTLRYKKAYDSLKACPLRFNHPSEAQQLHGLGPKLCERLTEKLKRHCSQNGLPMPEPPHKSQRQVLQQLNKPNLTLNKKGHPTNDKDEAIQ